MLQSRADIGDQRFEDGHLAMHRRQVQRRLPSMAGSLDHGCEQQRPARDGLHARARVGRPALPTPPVVGQRAGPRCGLAAVDVLRSEATHPPLVLELIETVLAVSTVAVELPDGLQRVRHITDHHRVLPQPLTGDPALDAMAHDHHPAPSTPTLQPQLIFHHLAALAVRSAPVSAGKLARHQALHVGRLAQSQQVSLLAAFELQQHSLVAVTRVAPDHGRAFVAQLVKQSPQRGPGVHTGVLLA